MKLIQEIHAIVHSDHPLILLFSDVLGIISAIWHYPLFKADSHPIAVSNVIIGCILFTLSFRLANNFSLFIRNKLSRSAHLDYNSINSLERISYYAFIIVTSFFVLDVSNVPLTAFTVVGTTIALGVGLGSQALASNFLSGLIIMIEKPIKLGDIIEVKNVVGKVINIGARCVSLRTSKNINMLIPNSNILQDSVINWTLNDANLKVTVPIQIQPQHDIAEVDALLYQAINLNKNILKDPAPLVLLSVLHKEYFTFELEFWIDLDKGVSQAFILNELNRALIGLLQLNQITLGEKKP